MQREKGNGIGMDVRWKEEKSEKEEDIEIKKKKCSEICEEKKEMHSEEGKKDFLNKSSNMN